MYPLCIEACKSGELLDNIAEQRWNLRPVKRLKLGVALTWSNTTGPPCSHGDIIRLEAAWRHRLACTGEAACRPAVEYYRRQQTTTDDSDRASNNYRPRNYLSGVILNIPCVCYVIACETCFALRCTMLPRSSRPCRWPAWSTNTSVSNLLAIPTVKMLTVGSRALYCRC